MVVDWFERIPPFVNNVVTLDEVLFEFLHNPSMEQRSRLDHSYYQILSVYEP